MSETSRRLTEAIAREIAEREGRALEFADLAFEMMEMGHDATAEVFRGMCRKHRVKALELRCNAMVLRTDSDPK